MPLRQKKLSTFFITNENQDLKKLCGMVEARLLHSGGSVCLLGGLCLQSGGSWRPVVPSLVLHGWDKKDFYA